MMTRQFLFLAFMAMTLCIACTPQVQVGVTVIDQDSYTELMKDAQDAQLIDIRTPEEYSEGFIDKAVNINFFDDDFLAQMEKLDKTAPLYIYCRSGGRSGKASKQLSAAGFENIYDIGCGYSGWDHNK